MKAAINTCVLIVGLSVTSVLLADALIGVASTRGSMEVNDATVRGNANVLEGASIRTNETSSQVNLQNGAEVILEQRSVARIHTGRVQLVEGAAQATIRGGFDIEALGFHVTCEKSKASARVSYANPNRVLVSALSGPINVLNRDGVLLTRVATGSTYFFEQDPPQDQAAATAGKKNSKSGTKGGGIKSAKTGISAGAKWGIVAGVAAAGAGVGLGVGLTGGSTSR